MIKFHLTSRSSQRMQLDPADFMPAAQMPKDRREWKVVLKGKQGLRACVCSQSRITGQKEKKEGARFIRNAKHCSRKAAGCPTHGCCSVSDGQNEKS